MSTVMTIVLVVVLAFATLLILPRILMARKTAKLRGNPAPTPHKPSAKRIRSGARTVLYSSTPTCHACRQQDPVVTKLQKRYPDAIYKLDATKQRETASAYGVMSVPFLAFIADGKLVSARAGVQREEAIAGFLTGDRSA